MNEPIARILVVDDEAPLMKALCDTLRANGYETVGYTSGKAALAALKESKFDLLLSDLMMPEMGGIAVLRAALEIDPHLVGIIMTGEGTVNTAVEAMKTGALDYILKPFKLSVILPVLSRALDVRRLRLENAELERRVRERTVRLDAANREIQAQYQRVQEANRLKSEFLANMSHELRTPLNAIIGFSELMHEGKVGEVSPEQKEYLGDILTSGLHLLQLINDVLDLAKVEAGKMEFHPEPLDLDAVIGEVRTVLRTLMAQKRIVADIEVDATLTGITADPAKLKQVLYNFLSNAIKFSPEGGRVEVRALPQGLDRYRIEVEDYGVGIRGEDLPRLFSEFQQIDSGMAKKYQGTGLGLALTKRMVEAQGGEVGVQSHYGKGSVFYAVLPRQGIATGEETRLPMRLAPVSAPLLLVVDDNREDLAWLTRTLEESGYRTEAVMNGEQAVARCGEKRFDAIVLDLILPDVSGWRVLKAVQEAGPNRETPVIIVSVLNDKAKVRAAAAVQAFLTKPVSRDALVQALEQAGIHAGVGNRILVVDDDLRALKLAENVLTDLGYNVLTAADGESGFALLEQHDPDAVVLDLLMPGMSGFEFLDRVAALPGGMRTTIMVWTVKDLTVEERRQLHAQAHAVVNKGDPQGISPLLDTLRNLVTPRNAGGHVERRA